MTKLDRRTLRRGPRPDSGAGRPPTGVQTVRISSRMPTEEHEDFRRLSSDLNESQAILRAIRLWVATAKEREGGTDGIPNTTL